MNADKLRRWLPVVHAVASMSKDRSTKVGAIALGPAWENRAQGWNGFPRGVNDDVASRHERPEKYIWTEHAERNLIYNAARVGVPLDGCVLLVSHPPCSDCARAIVQVGFVGVAFPAAMGLFKERWQAENEFSSTLFKEVGLEVLVL